MSAVLPSRDEVAYALAASNSTSWDFVPGGMDDQDPYYRDADAMLTLFGAAAAGTDAARKDI